VIADIFQITVLCIVIGGASIPLSFAVNSSPWIVYAGNVLGSLLSALFVVYVGNRITSDKFKKRVSKRRMGRKVITVFEEGEDNKSVTRVRILVNKHGLRVFSFICPIFPGVLLSTAAVYLLDLDRDMYKHWMIAGVFFASGIYVFGYWWLLVR
jgi:hypothetical protein